MHFRTLFLTGVLAATVPLYGQLVDPATLHVGPGFGTSCEKGCAGEPNTFGSSGGNFDIYQNQGGTSNTITSGNLLVILAVPTGQTPGTTITETDYNAAGTSTGTGTVTLVSNSATLTSTQPASTDIYGQLNLNDGDNSNNVTNLFGHEVVSGVTSFTLYEYKLTGSDLVNQGYADFKFNSIPLGTYVVGYGCDTSLTTINGTTGCSNSSGGFSNGDTFSTPFTEAGEDTGHNITPEPTAIVLLGSSMIGIGAIVRRRRSRLAQ